MWHIYMLLIQSHFIECSVTRMWWWILHIFLKFLQWATGRVSAAWVGLTLSSICKLNIYHCFIHRSLSWHTQYKYIEVCMNIHHSADTNSWDFWISASTLPLLFIAIGSGDYYYYYYYYYFNNNYYYNYHYNYYYLYY